MKDENGIFCETPGNPSSAITDIDNNKCSILNNGNSPPILDPIANTFIPRCNFATLVSYAISLRLLMVIQISVFFNVKRVIPCFHMQSLLCLQALLHLYYR